MKIDDIREKLDKLDESLLKTLAERFFLSEEIAELKMKNNMPVLDEEREKEMLENKKKLAEKLGLDIKTVESIFEVILKRSRQIQKDIIQGEISCE